MCYNTLCSSVNCLVCPTLVWGVESKLTFTMAEGRATKSKIGRNTHTVFCSNISIQLTAMTGVCCHD